MATRATTTTSAATTLGCDEVERLRMMPMLEGVLRAHRAACVTIGVTAPDDTALTTVRWAAAGSLPVRGSGYVVRADGDRAPVEVVLERVEEEAAMVCFLDRLYGPGFELVNGHHRSHTWRLGRREVSLVAELGTLTVLIHDVSIAAGSTPADLGAPGALGFPRAA